MNEHVQWESLARLLGGCLKELGRPGGRREKLHELATLLGEELGLASVRLFLMDPKAHTLRLSARFEPVLGEEDQETVEMPGIEDAPGCLRLFLRSGTRLLGVVEARSLGSAPPPLLSPEQKELLESALAGWIRHVRPVAAERSRPAEPKEEPSLQRPPEIAARGETILVIDDEKMVLGILTRGLRALGYEVLAASSGRQAVQIAETHPGVIQGAILDLAMPDMNGPQVYPLLRAVRPDLRIMICSGFAPDEEARSLLSSGVRRFLQKPVRLQELGRSLREMLEEE